MASVVHSNFPVSTTFYSGMKGESPGPFLRSNFYNLQHLDERRALVTALGPFQPSIFYNLQLWSDRRKLLWLPWPLSTLHFLQPSLLG